MSQSKTVELKSITKEDFNKLESKYRTSSSIYIKIINEFMNSSEDIAEVIFTGLDIKHVCHSIKYYSQKCNYLFLIRRRENRIFILKRIYEM